MRLNLAKKNLIFILDEDVRFAPAIFSSIPIWKSIIEILRERIRTKNRSEATSDICRRYLSSPIMIPFPGSRVNLVNKVFRKVIEIRIKRSGVHDVEIVAVHPNKHSAMLFVGRQQIVGIVLPSND